MEALHVSEQRQDILVCKYTCTCDLITTLESHHYPFEFTQPVFRYHRGTGTTTFQPPEGSPPIEKVLAKEAGTSSKETDVLSCEPQRHTSSSSETTVQQVVTLRKKPTQFNEAVTSKSPRSNEAVNLYAI